MKYLQIMLFCACTCTASAQISTEEFLADLDQLTALVNEEHAAPFWITSEVTFDEGVTEARQTILDARVVDERGYVELLKLMALLNDGHSIVSGSSRYALFGYLPLSFKWFDGELRVVRAAESYASILGARIDAVNNVPISEVFKILRTVVPHANASRFKKYAGAYLHLPGLLYGLGISDDPKRAMFSFSKNGSTVDLEVADLPPDQEGNTTFVDWERTNPPAWYQIQNDRYYWFDYDESTKTLYFQYNRVGSMEEESVSAFASRMFAFVDSTEIDRFVLDMRNNGGGNFAYSLRFVQGILNRPRINSPGKLFVITGYNTFSAAIDMLTLLENRSHAILIGEPAGDHPASPGDPESYTLSNSNIKVNLSSHFHPTVFLSDKRDYNLLDLEVVTTWDDYRKSHDPVMDAILLWDSPPPRMVEAPADQPDVTRYAYLPDQDLVISNVDGTLWLQIGQSVRTPLYVGRGSRMSTEIEGLSITMYNGFVTLHAPDGTSGRHSLLEGGGKNALDYIYAGEVEKAAAIYRIIQMENPDYLSLKDHQMNYIANLAFFDLEGHPDINATKVAREVLLMGITLNNGDAPFCEFALRFYPTDD